MHKNIVELSTKLVMRVAPQEAAQEIPVDKDKNEALAPDGSGETLLIGIAPNACAPRNIREAKPESDVLFLNFDSSFASTAQQSVPLLITDPVNGHLPNGLLTI